MRSSLDIPAVILRAGRMLRSDAGAALLPRVLGVLAKPLDPSYEADLRKEIHSADTESSESNKLIEKPEIAKRMIRSLSVGHLVSAFGLALLAVQSKLPKSMQHGFIDGIFKNTALMMTLFGAPLGIWGRATGAHDRLILGSELYGDYHLKQAQRKGFDIFTNYRPEQISDLIAASDKLAKTLEYETNVNAEIHSRHLKDLLDDGSKGNKSGGLFCGAPGTGKTIGVQLVLGNWAKTVKEKGLEPVITGLDLANFHKFLQETQREKNNMIELLNAGSDGERKLLPSLVDNQGLTILEVLIGQIEKKSREVAKHNRDNPSAKQKLFFVVDEFDKILVLKNLQGADKVRLRNAVLRLNELFENQNILLTSNTPLKEMVSQLKDLIDDEAVWKPFESRLNANHVSVDEPSTRVQARIFAGRILHDYPSAIDWAAFKISPSGVFDVDKAALGDFIHQNILEPLRSTYTGRELNSVSLDVKPRLLARAVQERIDKRGANISDNAWGALGDLDKIAVTKVKVSPELLQDLLLTKHELIKGKRDPLREEAYSVIDSYLDYVSRNRQALEIPQGTASADIFDSMQVLYNKENAVGRDIYRAKSPIILGDKVFNHRIVHDKPSVHKHPSTDQIRVEFEQADNLSKSINPADLLRSSLKYQPAKTTLSLGVEEFSQYFRPRFLAAQQTQVDKALSGFTQAIGNTLDNALGKALGNNQLGKLAGDTLKAFMKEAVNDANNPLPKAA